MYLFIVLILYLNCFIALNIVFNPYSMNRVLLPGIYRSLNVN